MRKSQMKNYELLRSAIEKSDITIEHFSKPNNINEISFSDIDMENALNYAIEIGYNCFKTDIIKGTAQRLIQQAHEKSCFKNEKERLKLVNKISPLMK